MIIQCEKCKTRFRLDDSRINEAGVRVRCSKCSHTFVVRKEEPGEENDFDLILQKFDQPEAKESESESPAGTTADTPGPVFSFDAGSPATEEKKEAEESPISPPEAPGAEEKPVSSDSEFSLGDDSTDKPFSWGDEPAVPEGEKDVCHIEESSSGAAQAPGTVDTPVASDTAIRIGEDWPNTDFSWGAEPSTGEEVKEAKPVDESSTAALEAAPEPDTEPAPSVDEYGGFYQKGVGIPQFQMPHDTDQGDGADADKGTVQPDSMWSMPDYSVKGPSVEQDSSVVIPSEKQEAAPPQEGVISDQVKEPENVETVGQPRDGQFTDIREELSFDAGPTESTSATENLSPLPIASRRKGASLMPLFLGLVLVLVVAGGVIYLVKFKSEWLSGILPAEISHKLGIGKKAPAVASIRSMEGNFVVNKDAGELFVLRGEAVNSSGKPLSSLKVRGVLYGAGGTVLAERTVFCGSVLTKDELEIQPYASLEKAMNKQFGDNLANFQVAPGKVIPFVLVFKDVPKGTKDYGVEIADVTGAGLK